MPAELSAWKTLSSATQPQELQTNSLETMSNITVSLSHCLQYVGLSERICCSADSIAIEKGALLLSLVFLEIRKPSPLQGFYMKKCYSVCFQFEF
jgi:hypothetical protein